jgi:archaellum component FlaG (FlaF/FlaG flagellin family)
MGGFSITRRKIALGSAVAVMAAGGAVAYAYFTSTGSGNGSASVGSAASWAVTVSHDSSAALFPGSGSETLTYTIKNVGGGNQELNAVSISVADAGGCLGSWFTATDNGGDHAVPSTMAPGAVDTGTLRISLNETNSDQDACQGISPQVTVSAS